MHIDRYPSEDDQRVISILAFLLDVNQDPNWEVVLLWYYDYRRMELMQNEKDLIHALEQEIISLNTQTTKDTLMEEESDDESDGDFIDFLHEEMRRQESKKDTQWQDKLSDAYEEFENVDAIQQRYEQFQQKTKEKKKKSQPIEQKAAKIIRYERKLLKKELRKILKGKSISWKKNYVIVVRDKILQHASNRRISDVKKRLFAFFINKLLYYQKGKAHKWKEHTVNLFDYIGEKTIRVISQHLNQEEIKEIFGFKFGDLFE